MRWWKRKKNRLPQKPSVDTVFRKMADLSFPRGEDQITQEAAELAVLLQERASKPRAREILVHAKGRLLIALRSASDVEEAVQRCVDSILARWGTELDRATAEEVAAFAYRRLVGQHPKSRQNAPLTFADITKEEGLLVARITAYRIARHLGRTDAQVQHVYDLDPKLYIAGVVQHLLTHEFEGRPKSIDTRNDALNLCINVAGTLALICHAEENDTDSTPDSEEIDHFAREELELTLSVVRSPDAVTSYPDFDPSEARAAHDLQIPFAVALRLGEVGLLKDPPGPTESRRESLADAIRRLQDI